MIYLKTLFHFIAAELGTSDAHKPAARWKQRGDTLLSHAMLAVGVIGIVSIAVPNPAMLIAVAAALFTFYAFGKELLVDHLMTGETTFWDSAMDTIGVGSGLGVALALIIASPVAFIVSLLVLVCSWLSYPAGALRESA